MSERCDIAVVGAGAAGLAAGIFAAEAAREAGVRARLVLLDGAKSIGAKILVSGGGRCNVTHEVVRVGDYNGNANIIRNVLAAFDEQATVRWFESMGVALKREETGKLFPVTDKARTVLEALLRRCAQVGVEIWTGHRVHAVEKSDGGFRVRSEQGELIARRVVLATGGRSLPRTGSDGFGYELARSLGHMVTGTWPALVPLMLEESFFHKDVQGLAHEAELATLVEKKPVDRRMGSLLWTHFGISGPLAMDASRHWLVARSSAEGANVELRVSFLPGMQFEQVEQSLIPKDASRARRSSRATLSEHMPERLAEALLRHAGIEPATPVGAVTRERRRALAHALTGLVLPVTRDRGWNYAEVTAGGVPLTEINYRRMESRKTEHVYLIGEILDCDGRIGGFNFQWAWASGYVAGRAAAVSLRSD